MFWLKLTFAGLGHLVAHWSEGVLILAFCAAVEFAGGMIVAYVPLLAKPIAWLQKYVLFIAIGTACVLLGEYIGAKDIADRCAAKAAVVEQKVDSVVKGTKTPAAQAQPDPYDSPEN